MVKPENLQLDQILQNVVLYLLMQEQQAAKQAAQLLIECEIDEIRSTRFATEDYCVDYWAIILAAPHSIHKKIENSPVWEWLELTDENCAEKYPLLYVAQKAFEVVLRKRPVLIETYVQLIVDNDGNWREHLRKVAEGKLTSNQGRQFESNQSNLIVWNNLNFRSQAEIKIAEALDRKGILYLPNCAARLGPMDHRYNREPDFLICHEGKWGILQVDGKAFHQRAADDANWSQQFMNHGVRMVLSYPATECFKTPDEVVAKFLNLLKMNG